VFEREDALNRRTARMARIETLPSRPAIEGFLLLLDSLL
jgi:hypothetical protein